jgi:hypothetical protein
MVDQSRIPDESGAIPQRQRSGWRRIFHWILVGFGFGVPALFILFGAGVFLAGSMQAPREWHDALTSSGLIYAGFGVVWLAVAAGVAVRLSANRREKAAEADELINAMLRDGLTPAQIREIDQVDLSPAERVLARERMDAARARRTVPEPITVMLPWSLNSRPAADARPWWLAPMAVLVILPLVGSRARSATLFVWSVAFGVILAVGIGLLQFRYVYRRRLIVDDLTVSFRGALGQVASVPPADVRRIALRIVLGQRVMENRLLVLGADDRCRMRVARFGLTYEEASQLAAVLRVPIDVDWDHPTTLQDMEREMPGCSTWSERHRFLFGALVMIPIVLFAAAVTLIGQFH